MRIKRIISGGQTGVDRAALDVAIALGIEAGGWCPRGRKAENGVIPARYRLRQTESSHYDERTRLNVRDSDATLILNTGPLEGGTNRTIELAQRLARPCLILDIDEKPHAENFAAWIARHHVSVLNVAGPRESKRPGIQERAAFFLASLLEGPPRP